MTLLLSLAAENYETIRRRLQASLSRGLITGYELRLDRAPQNLDLAKIGKEFGPFVATCLPQSQGGLFEGTPEAWADRLTSAARAGADFVDIPLNEEVLDLPDSCHRIHSIHERPGVFLKLEDELAKAVARCKPGDYCKIVSWASALEDAARATRLYTIFDAMEKPDGVRLLAFAQGPGGRASRLHAPALGAPWMYVSWPGETLAPGQYALYDFLPAEIGPETSLLGVVGKPTEHSRSPLLWNAAFQSNPALGAAVYAAQEAKDLASFLKDYAAKPFRAFSVTTPLKNQLMEVADAWTESVEEAGAGNFLMRKGDLWIAKNSDGLGALDAMEDARLSSGKVLIYGWGPAARSVAFEAHKRGYTVSVAVRTPEKVTVPSSMELLSLADAIPADYDGVVQATPVGSAGKPGNFFGSGRLPKRGSVILDLVYQPAQTDLLNSAKEAGATPVFGAQMLLHQMKHQFEWVTGTKLALGPLRQLLLADLGLATHSIFLLGLPGSGKTTLGRGLAQKIGWDFVDADAALTESTGRTPAEWIQKDGESAFRIAEASLLEDLLAKGKTVVALGGGIVTTPSALGWLRQFPHVLALHTSLSTLQERQASAPRPALTDLSPEDELQKLWEQRATAYDLAAQGRWFSTNGEELEVLSRIVSATEAWHDVN